MESEKERESDGCRLNSLQHGGDLGASARGGY